MARPQVTVVGAGNVGASVAQRVAEGGLADVVLIDIVEGLPQGKALDLAESAPVVGHDMKVVGTNDYADTAGSDIVVVTSGLARQPGMSRDDLLSKNSGIVRSVVEQAMKHSPDAILIIVTNPLDAMCHVALEASGLPPAKVIGMAGVLDSARFRTLHRRGAGRQREQHARRRPGRPRRHDGAAAALLHGRRSAHHRAALGRAHRSARRPDAQRWRGDRRAAQDRQRLYAPAASVAQMVDSILNDRNEILPCAALLEGQYGVDGLFVGVPVKLGRAGITQIVEIELTESERSAFDHPPIWSASWSTPWRNSPIRRST